MNRRSFLTSMAATGGAVVLRRSSCGQAQSGKLDTAAAQQSESIRHAALRLTNSLSPEHKDKLTCPFPNKQTPLMAKFTRQGGPGGSGGPGGPDRSGAPGNANNHGDRLPGPSGPGHLGGPQGGVAWRSGGPPGGFAFIGEKYGDSMWTNFPVSEASKQKQQVLVVDPTGAWYGIRSSADGEQPGFEFVIFGGEHADVPLEDTAGELVATTIVEQGFSAVLDLSLFRKAQLQRFMAPFLETLYRLNRNAMLLVVDEADTVAPQKPFGEEARTLGAMQDVVRRGRIRGIGCVMFTQRPQVLNKDVLTQADMLIAAHVAPQRHGRGKGVGDHARSRRSAGAQPGPWHGPDLSGSALMPALGLCDPCLVYDRNTPAVIRIDGVPV